jgi:V/A-type H+-transporting ATPase subunit E
MALDAVVAEIREKGRREAEAIRSETQKDVKEILVAAQEDVAAIKLAADEDVDRQTGHIIRQEVAAANLVVKRRFLNTQKGLLEEVYEAAVAAIADLPGDFHANAVRVLLERAVTEIPVGTVYCCERDQAGLEEALSREKKFGGYSFGGTVDIDGGILAESRDAKLQLDYSYATLLGEVWESGLKEASDILFG